MFLPQPKWKVQSCENLQHCVTVMVVGKLIPVSPFNKLASPVSHLPSLSANLLLPYVWIVTNINVSLLAFTVKFLF